MPGRSAYRAEIAHSLYARPTYRAVPTSPVSAAVVTFDPDAQLSLGSAARRRSLAQPLVAEKRLQYLLSGFHTARDGALPARPRFECTVATQQPSELPHGVVVPQQIAQIVVPPPAALFSPSALKECLILKMAGSSHPILARMRSRSSHGSSTWPRVVPVTECKARTSSPTCPSLSTSVAR